MECGGVLDIKGMRIFLFLGVAIVLVAGGIFSLILKVNGAIHSEETKRRIEASLEMAREQLESEIDKALSLAIVIADRERIKEGYLKGDRVLLYQEITEQIARLRQGAGYEHLDIQLHTPEPRSYVRSWDFETFGVELSPFRKGIMKVKETQKPLASIELGQRLNIKAISPILYQGRYLGSAEVLLGFERVLARLLQKGVRLFILMEERHLKVATRLEGNERLNGMVLVDSACPSSCLERLRESLDSEALARGYVRSGEFLFGFSPFFSFDGERLGYLGVFFDGNQRGEATLFHSILPAKIPSHHEVEMTIPPLRQGNSKGVVIR